jgi:hypothetical protein
MAMILQPNNKEQGIKPSIHISFTEFYHFEEVNDIGKESIREN